MLRKQVTVFLCTVAMTGLILNGCSNSESAEATSEETNSEQQEEEANSGQLEEEAIEEESSMDEEPVEEAESIEEPVESVFGSGTTDQAAGTEESSNTSQAASTSAVEPGEMELEGGETMAVAPEIPLNTKVTWSTKEDEKSEWYAFKAETGAEDMVYQVAIGGMASNFSVSIYQEGENEALIEENGNPNGATKVIDLDDLESGKTYYVYLDNVNDKTYYVLITPVSAH